MKRIQSDINVPFSLLDKEQLAVFQQLISNLSASQVIWLSGYLWGISSTKNFDQECIIDGVRDDIQKVFRTTSDNTSCAYITILSASQTGNARRLSEELYASLVDEQFAVRLFNVADYRMKKISQEKLLFLIISTYGEGEPPEEAVMLHKYLFSKNAPSMKNIYFSVFGLGDRSYTYFSKAAKDFDVRLEELGGSRIYKRIDADVNYYEEASNWRREIVSLLKREFMDFNTRNLVSDYNHQHIVDNTIVKHDKYTKESPFLSNLILRQRITSRNAVKDVYHLELDLSGSDLHYKPGDVLGVWYENDPILVDELLGYCNFIGNEEVEVNDKLIPLSQALQKYCELTHNTQWFARNYANLVNNEELLSLFSDKDNFNKFILSTAVIDMIRLWPPQGFSPKKILSLFRPLTPRFYSIASSQDEVGEEVHITVSVVRYQVDNVFRSGGASGYLVERLSEGAKLRVFIVSNDNFRLPKDSSISIIMIAAGTGIAPFRAFIQQRCLDRALGKNWLFFGNLNFQDDFLYQREWQGYVKNGILTHINTAWSRDQKHKVYVQDKIVAHGLEVWQWIEQGAYIYVCGDASRMAKSVETSLIQLGVEYGKMDFKESDAFFNDMRTRHRYQKDVY